MFQRTRLFVASAALIALGGAAGAQETQRDVGREVEELRRQMAEMERRHREEIEALRRQVGAGGGGAPTELQRQIDDLIDRMDEVDTQVAATRTAAPARTAYIDVSANTLVVVGGSTARETVIQQLEGGHHEPHKRGFTLQNSEIVLTGAVDPYFRAQMNVVATIDEEGETVVELEEAFAQTTSLPYGLQVKAGQYFTEFGRHNPKHPHQWEFVDAPVANNRFFGPDGMRGPGARLSWLAPTEFPLEFQIGAQNANGETQVGFLGTEEEEPPFGAFVEREVRTWEDLAWTARVAGGFDLTDEIPVQLGLSRAFGPSGASADRNASVTGIDFVAKWKPLANDHGFPFVAVEAEWMKRHYGFDDFVQDGAFVPGGRIDDAGGYAQVVYGFQRSWTLGVRHDRTQGDVDDVFGLDDRTRWSVALTYYTSEFAKVRLQVNRDRAQSLDRPETSVWLQLEFNLGPHGAHKF